MLVSAKVKHLRMSPRKVRLVIDVIRGMKVGEALDQLRFTNKKVVKPIEKLINSCIANAVNNYELDKDNLKVAEINVDEGKTLHRWMPRAHGRATPIRKRTSHISISLAEIKDSGKIKTKSKKIEAPVKLGEEPRKANEVKVKKDEKSEKKHEEKEEKGKEIVDPRMEGRGGHAKVEGGRKGFASRIFRRKSG